MKILKTSLFRDKNLTLVYIGEAIEWGQNKSSLGTGHYLPGGEGYYFFEKWLKKKYDPPLQHDKKIMTLPQRRVKKIVTLPLTLFLIFI